MRRRERAWEWARTATELWQGTPIVEMIQNRDLRQGPDLGGEERGGRYLPAVERYEGRLYTNLQESGRRALQASRHHVLILSGLYGMVTPTELIQYYSYPVRQDLDSGLPWTDDEALTRLLIDYVEHNGVRRVFDFIGDANYRSLIAWDDIRSKLGGNVLHAYGDRAAGADLLAPFGKFLAGWMLQQSGADLLRVRPDVAYGDIILGIDAEPAAGMPRQDDLPQATYPRDFRASNDFDPGEDNGVVADARLLPPEARRNAGPWRIELPPEFCREMAKEGADARMRAWKAIVKVARDPVLRNGGDTIKPLTGPLRGLWRCREGSYRLVYEPDGISRSVTLRHFGPRGDIYDA